MLCSFVGRAAGTRRSMKSVPTCVPTGYSKPSLSESSDVPGMAEPMARRSARDTMDGVGTDEAAMIGSYHDELIARNECLATGRISRTDGTPLAPAVDTRRVTFHGLAF